MANWEQKEASLTVPQGAGVPGLLRIIGEIMKLKVLSLAIDAAGKVTYTYLVRPGQPEQVIGVDLESLSPYAVVRGSTLRTYVPEGKESAAVSVARLFRMVQLDHLVPIGFVASTASTVFRWFQASTGLDLSEHPDVFYGLPLYRDRHVPDETLILCAGYLRGAALPDTTHSYSVTMLTETP